MEIKALNLSKNYGNKVAVKNFSINIEPGKIIGLLGPNGAGKSTVIKMLSGQIEPTSGSIQIDGHEYKKIPNSLRGKIGVMPQELIIWDDLNIKENLMFSASLQNLSKETAIKRTDLLINELNLLREVNTLAKNLSGGYKRRLNLAISIIHDPSLVFLDEPSAGVDPQNRLFLWEYIKSLKKQKNHSILLTDHYIEEAEKLSDYVVIVDKSEVIASGTVDELKKKYSDESVVNIIVKDKDSLNKDIIDKLDANSIIDNEITLHSQNSTVSLEKALTVLNSNNIQIDNIIIRQSSLEDVFLNLTGKHIRE